MMNNISALAVDETPFPPATAVPHFLAVQAGSGSTHMTDKGDPLLRAQSEVASPALKFQPNADSGRDASVRTLNLPAGAGVAQRSSATAEVTPSVCTFPAGLSFEGEAAFPCDFAVMGSIKGKVSLTGQSKLSIAVGGKIEGEIMAKSISIDGEATGKIDASGGLVSFGENARCTGSIQYGRMSMAEGAEVEATMKKVA